MGKYLSSKEILNDQETKDKLNKWVSPSIRAGFPIQTVRKYFKGNGRVLDCGTASGEFLKILYETGFSDVFAIDIDDYVSEKNRKFLKDLKLADLSYDKFPYEDNFFDLVTGWCIVPHLENPYNFFREARRVLKPGGLLIVTLINIFTPSHRKYFYKHCDFPGFHDRNNHIALFPKAVFKKTVLRDFDLIGKEYFISPSIFNRGLKAKVRRFVYNIASNSNRAKRFFDERWGAKVAMILRKK
ncbi:MAG: methyltransferase domain-containing protein [Candidatus Harrisonbacteria bacterium]|nr:methyltransferase domain-containing protein [Candidatus Harrisonbacteria bacterium]